MRKDGVLSDNAENTVPVCPLQDSNLRSRLRRAVLYPLS